MGCRLDLTLFFSELNLYWTIMHAPKKFKPKNLPCPFPTCQRFFVNASGRTQHVNSAHTPFPRRDHSVDADGDVRMPSPNGSRASSNVGGGDAGDDPAPQPPVREVRYHPHLNGRSVSMLKRRSLTYVF
jgi:hypothetical protein